MQSKSTPRPLTTDKIDELLQDESIIFIDTREWDEFIAGHLRRSLYIPSISDCPTLIGSYITPDKNICLIGRDHDIDCIVRDGRSVGIDKFEFKLTPEQLIEWSKQGNELERLEEIDMRSFSEHLDQSDMFILDVRRWEELVELGKIGSAYNIAHTQLNEHYLELPQERRICVYCRTGVRSKYASAFLASKGYQVTHVSGGIFEWLEYNLPVQPAQ